MPSKKGLLGLRIVRLLFAEDDRKSNITEAAGIETMQYGQGDLRLPVTPRRVGPRGWRTSMVAPVFCLALVAAHAEDLPKPLAITVRDGIVLFDGANLDVDCLRDILADTGRQSEALMFRVGPNAKSAYIGQVLRAVRAAGFTRITIVSPSGQAIPMPPETTD